MPVLPKQQEFCRLATTHNLIPVITRLATDVETPVSLYYKVIGEQTGFMLESAETSRNFGRYSFLGLNPFALFKGYKEHAVVEAPEGAVELTGNPIDALRAFQAGFQCADIGVELPFAGGAVGFFNYEATASWERIRGMNIAPETVLAEFMYCRNLVIVDHLTHTTTLVELVYCTPGEDPVSLYKEAEVNLQALADKVQGPQVEMERLTVDGGTPVAVDEGAIKEQFMARVRAIKEHIFAGDIFQAVLSQPFTFPLERHPFTLYRQLRQVNPSPYMYYLNFPSRKIVGASPEMLVKRAGDTVITFPIAGTRPRGRNPLQDAALAEDMLADEKERAEHAMLVDLGRNDIGRVSIPGTVKVERYMEVENFSHVMHMVSEVRGRLDEKRYDALEALKACFPAGTVSGAPKIRAMEIVREQEGDERGFYAGSVGYVDFRGNMDMCITIRTLEVKDDKITVRTGAGIVADSVPETEFQEVLHKAKALLKVLGGA